MQVFCGRYKTHGDFRTNIHSAYRGATTDDTRQDRMDDERDQVIFNIF